MSVKKYLSLERLAEYDALLKAKIAQDDAAILDAAKEYIDEQVEAVNSSITSGDVVVKESEHATSADSATSAESATKSTQDGNGAVIADTYETKTDAAAKLTEAKSYADGKANEVKTYIGTIPATATATDIVGYVQEKTAGIATSENLQELTNRVAQAETDIDNIQKDYLTSTDKEELQGNIDTVTNAVELLTNGVDAETVDGVNDLIAYVNEHGAEVTGMKADIQANADAIDGLATVATTGSWNDLSDKPFIEEEIIYFEHTFSAADEDYNKEQLSLTVGKTYVVEVNGIEYDVVCEEEYGSGYKMIQFRTNENYGITIYEFQQSADYFPESVECHVILKDKDKVLNILEEYIPDTIARIEDVVDLQVQSDWNQSDETAVDYIKNRTHYDTSIVVVENAKLTLLFQEMADSVYQSVGNMTFDINKQYKIVFDTLGEIVVYPESAEKLSFDYKDGHSGYISSNEVYIKGSANILSIYMVGELKTLDEKFIPDTIARVSDVVDLQVQSDWNQNDESAQDFVKNRPFYEEVSETDISGTEYELPTGSGVQAHNSNIPFKLGQVWKLGYLKNAPSGMSWVYLDEMEVKEADDGTLYIGDYPNVEIVPYYVTSNEQNLTYEFTHTTGTYGLALTCVYGVVIEETVHQLDEKYIPDSIARVSDVVDLQVQSDWNQNDEVAADFVKNRTHWAEKKIVGETRVFDYGEYPADAFLENLYKNRQTARYIGSNGVEFYYNSDILNNSDVCKWIVTTGDGTTIGAMYVFDINNKIFFADVSDDNPITITVSSEIIEEVHPLDEKFIPDSIARVSDVVDMQVQSDWNQNDDTALDYIKNRTHYEEQISETREFVSDGWSGGGRITDAEFTNLLWEERKNAIYIANGNEYIYEGEYFSSGLSSTPDNVKVIKADDENSYFHVTFNFSDGTVRFGGQNANVSDFENGSITVNTNRVYQIDEKYIPDTIVRVSDIEEISEAEISALFA